MQRNLGTGIAEIEDTGVVVGLAAGGVKGIIVVVMVVDRQAETETPGFIDEVVAPVRREQIPSLDQGIAAGIGIERPRGVRVDIGTGNGGNGGLQEIAGGQAVQQSVEVGYSHVIIRGGVRRG